MSEPARQCHLISTITMERLPTELVLQILGYMSKEELEVIGFISSEYRSLVVPFYSTVFVPGRGKRGGRASPV